MNAWLQISSALLGLRAFNIATLVTKLELFADLNRQRLGAAELWFVVLLAVARALAEAADRPAWRGRGPTRTP